MEENVRIIVKKIFRSQWSPSDIKVYLWYYIIATKECREKPISAEVIHKISSATGLSDKDINASLRVLNLVGPDNIAPLTVSVIPDNPSINSDRVKALMGLWVEWMGGQLTISEKIDFALLCDKIQNDSDIRDRIGNFNKYHAMFQGVTVADRQAAYLFRNSFRSFLNNFDKFGDKFHGTLAEHQARFKAYKEKPVCYGFSSNPIEDRKLATEDELENICFAIETTGEYNSPIVFPDNLTYYKKALKKLEKKKEG